MTVITTALLVAACGSSGPGGKVTVADVQSTQSLGGAIKHTTATLDVTGPVKNGAVMCEFAGDHIGGGGNTFYTGYTVYVLVPDLAEGASTRTTCDAGAFGIDLAPSSPIVQLVSRGSMPTPRPSFDAEYVPATPWP